MLILQKDPLVFTTSFRFFLVRPCSGGFRTKKKEKRKSFAQFIRLAVQNVGRWMICGRLCSTHISFSCWFVSEFAEGLEDG